MNAQLEVLKQQIGLKDGDVVEIDYDGNRWKKGKYVGYFYFASGINALICDFLLTDKKQEDWNTLYGGYTAGFNFDKVRMLLKLNIESREAAA